MLHVALYSRNLAPGMASMGRSRCSNNLAQLEPVTESNHRPSPYHGAI